MADNENVNGECVSGEEESSDGSYESGEDFEQEMDFEGDDENEEDTVEDMLEGNESTDRIGKGKGPAKVRGGRRQGKRKRKKIDPTKRRHIRRILEESELDKETLNAQMEEKERLRRLELQKSLAAESSVAPKIAINQTKNEENSSNRTRTPSPVVVDLRQKNKKKSQVIVIDSDDNDDVTCSNTSPSQVQVITSGSDSDTDVWDSEYYSDNEVIDETNTGVHSEDAYNVPDEQGRVLVNTNHPVTEEDIFLAPQIASAVKPHQIGGIRFLYDNLIETLARCNISAGFGCILAHCMGLGKTLQVVAFVDIFLRHTTAKKVLCIVPINTIQNWLSEFNSWLPGKPSEEMSENGEPIRDYNVRYREFKVFLLGDNQKSTVARAKVIGEWNESGGVLLIGYELYRILALSTPCMASNKCAPPKKKKKEQSNSSQEPEIIDLEEEEKNMDFLIGIQKALCKPGPDLVICDEGHRIKNNQANISHALKKIKTRRRVVLTGYPLQNNLVEYWCMVDFVRPNFLGNRHEFSNMFERPIMNGQCCDSTPADMKLMRFRAHVLHSLLEGFVQRRSQSVLMKALPPKNEHVILVNMSSIQSQLYKAYIDYLLKSVGHLNPIKGFHTCMKIWNHPDIFFSTLEGKTDSQRNDSPLTLPDQEDSNSGLASSLPSSSQSVDQTPIFSNLDWAKQIMRNYKPFIAEQGGKMVLLFEIIEESLKLGEKILIFSQSLSTLSIIEEFLNSRVVPFFPGRQSDPSTKWARNKSYFRLDGSTSAQERERLINAFNDNSSNEVLLFMLSTRAGCLGVNLVGASRVVVFDSSWNPCHDVQAVCRVYRYGQVRPCHIYRLIATGTMEKKIYDRQVSKQGVANRVVDELNPEANFTKQEIMSLICEEEPLVPSQDVSVAAADFQDPILKRVCTNCSEWIAKVPFKHESLLVDKKELKLTKEEKREAKKGYEMEKRMAHQGARYCLASQAQTGVRIPQATVSGVKRPIVTVNPVQASQTRPTVVPSTLFQGQLSGNMPWAIQYATLNPQMTANPITVGPNVPYAVIPNPGVPLGNNFSSVMPSTMSPSLPFFVAPLAANQMPYPALPHLAGPGNALPLGQEGMVGPRPLNLPMPAINQGSVAMTSLTNSLSVMPSVAGPGRESRKEVVTIDLDDLPSPTLDKTKESQPSPSPQGDRSSSTSTEEVVTELEVAEAPRTGAPPSNEVHSYLTNHSGAMGAGPSVTSASPALTLAVLQNLLNARGGLAADAPVRPVSEGEAESAPLGDRVSQAEEPDEAIM